MKNTYRSRIAILFALIVLPFASWNAEASCRIKYNKAIEEYMAIGNPVGLCCCLGMTYAFDVLYGCCFSGAAVLGYEHCFIDPLKQVVQLLNAAHFIAEDSSDRSGKSRRINLIQVEKFSDAEVFSSFYEKYNRVHFLNGAMGHREVARILVDADTTEIFCAPGVMPTIEELLENLSPEGYLKKTN